MAAVLKRGCVLGWAGLLEQQNCTLAKINLLQIQTGFCPLDVLWLQRKCLFCEATGLIALYREQGSVQFNKDWGLKLLSQLMVKFMGSQRVSRVSSQRGLGEQP